MLTGTKLTRSPKRIMKVKEKSHRGKKREKGKGMQRWICIGRANKDNISTTNIRQGFGATQTTSTKPELRAASNHIRCSTNIATQPRPAGFHHTETLTFQEFLKLFQTTGHAFRAKQRKQKEQDATKAHKIGIRGSVSAGDMAGGGWARVLSLQNHLAPRRGFTGSPRLTTTIHEMRNRSHYFFLTISTLHFQLHECFKWWIKAFIFINNSCKYLASFCIINKCKTRNKTHNISISFSGANWISTVQALLVKG